MVGIAGKLICLQFSLVTCTVKRKMPTFREAREVLLYAISKNMVSDEEFALLYDVNTSKNRNFIGFTMLLIYTKSQMMIVWQNSGFKKNDILRLVISTSTS